MKRLQNVVDYYDDESTDDSDCEPAAKKGGQHWERFNNAMDQGDHKQVKELLEEGVNKIALNWTRGHPGKTPLEWASERGLVEIANLMIEKGAKVEAGYLTLAYVSGDLAMMKLLIDHGVNVNKTMLLHRACRDDRPEMITFLLESGADPRAQDEYERMPLHYAWSCEDWKIIKLLIEKCVDDLKVNDYLGTAPIHEACKHGQLELVKFLIQNGANANLRSAHRDTPLNIACKNGHFEIVKLLIANGADAHEENGRGHTPTNSACEEGYFEIVKFLFENGGKVNSKIKRGWTPLHCACKRGKSLEVIELLIKIGADLFATTDAGKTPLHVACHVNEVPLEIIKSLIEHGSDVNAKDNYGTSPFHLACGNKNFALAKLLLESGADLYSKDDRGKTPLHRDCDSLEVLRFLFENGVDPNTRDDTGRTALHEACVTNGNPKVASRFLIENGADLNAKDNRGNTPMHISCRADKLEAIKMLMESGANMNATNDEGSTPLFCQIHHCHFKIETTKFLLENGADVDTGALNLACSKGSFPLVKLFIEHGANPNEQDDQGATPFQKACWHGNLKILRFLIENNANLNVQDNNGATPLHKASDCRDPFGPVKLLIESGASLNASDNNGKTALYLACMRGHLEVVKLLLSRRANVESALIHAASERKRNLEVVWYLARKYPWLLL